MFDYHAWLNRFPGTNFHELNIDWIVEQLKALGSEMAEFEALNTITLDGIWDISKQYSRYTIVTDSNGDGYISLEPVPAGIQIDNTDYWMKLYDFVTALGVLDGRVTTLEGTVSNLSGRMTTAEGNITSLQGSINALNTYKANRTRSSFTDRNILFVGDSYTNGGNISGKKWYETMCDTINPGHYYVSTVGSEGFGLTCAKHYKDRIQDFIDNNSAAICQSITDLFITGGYNDITNTITDIQSASNNPYNMEKCVELIRQHFPNATIYIGYFARTALDKANGSRHNIINIERTATAYREGARWLGCKYIDRSEIMLHDYRLFDSDNVHPNQDGHNFLGHYVAQWFMNGAWSYNTTSNNNIRALLLTHNAADCVEGHMTKISPAFGTDNLYEQLTDEGVIIKMIDVAGSVTDGNNAFDCSPVTSVSANTFNLGYFNPPNYRAYFSLLGSNGSFRVMGTALIKDNSNVFHNIPCVISFTSNNEILLNFQEMSGNSYLHLDGLHDISYIAGFEAVIPLHAC